VPHNHQWQSRIKAVEREHVAMRQAANRFSLSALDDPTILRGNLRQAEIVRALGNLEELYYSFVCGVRNRNTRVLGHEVGEPVPRTVDLLDSLAAKCRIPDCSVIMRTRCVTFVTLLYTNARISRTWFQWTRLAAICVTSLATCRRDGNGIRFFR